MSAEQTWWRGVIYLTDGLVHKHAEHFVYQGFRNSLSVWEVLEMPPAHVRVSCDCYTRQGFMSVSSPIVRKLYHTHYYRRITSKTLRSHALIKF